MFEVSVADWFAAAHQLRLPDGSLEPLHGHNWSVTVTFAGPELDDVGLLVDFVAVRARLRAAAARLHDRHLNDLPDFAGVNPSAENVAVHFARALATDLPANVRVSLVAVEEAPGCVARYRPPAASHPRK